jgi:hypothetical protein
MRVLVAASLVFVFLGGCATESTPDAVADVADGLGSPYGGPLEDVLAYALSSVGERGPEPSIGITPTGCAFFVALEKVMRSCDGAATWERVDAPLMSPTSNDPYLWVDTATGRIFDIQMGPLTHTWIAWSDDDGKSWLGNPYDNGPTPVNDHIKVGSGPWVNGEQPGYNTVGDAVYDQAVYFCYNKLAGVFCYTSFDGGMTFPVGGNVVGQAGAGGLHGAITTAPDGTVYVPPRSATPTVYMSKDNGLSWESRTMGDDVGTPNPRKNTEIGTDSESNGYHVWVGEDHGVYMSRSTDSGDTWEQTSLRISPGGITSATFPHIDAGDPGHVAVAYLGATNFAGNPQVADGNETVEAAEYYLYLSQTQNGLDAEPVWTTIRLTDDPVQVGSICLNSGACSNGNRNLLDFNDLTMDSEGRVWIAYADGCIDACADGTDRSPATSRAALGTVAVQTAGPSLLFDEFGDLGPLADLTA